MSSRLIVSAALVLVAPAVFCQQPATPPIQQSQAEPTPHHHRTAHFERNDARHGEGPFGWPGERFDWWKSPEIAKRIELTPDQTKKLDDLSLQGRLREIHLRADLEEQETLLQPLLEGPSVDERKADLQIDKIAEARAALEKSDAKLQLSFRAVLTPEQWEKLHTPGEHRFHHPDGPGPGGPPQS